MENEGFTGDIDALIASYEEDSAADTNALAADNDDFSAAADFEEKEPGSTPAQGAGKAGPSGVQKAPIGAGNVADVDLTVKYFAPIEKFFEGYTPADLSALFRGFGDAIATMTSALANLLRSGGGDDNNGGNGNGGNGNGGNTTPADIPPTGDYAIPAVAAVALLAGAAFVLTRKKTEE